MWTRNIKSTLIVFQEAQETLYMCGRNLLQIWSGTQSVLTVENLRVPGNPDYCRVEHLLNLDNGKSIFFRVDVQKLFAKKPLRKRIEVANRAREQTKNEKLGKCFLLVVSLRCP